MLLCEKPYRIWPDTFCFAQMLRVANALFNKIRKLNILILAYEMKTRYNRRIVKLFYFCVVTK